MIYPRCEHSQDAGAAPSTGWILTCRQDYEAAVRRNMMYLADAKTAMQFERELVEARGRIQQLEADVQDVRMISKQAFGRCASCHRLAEVSKPCRWCAR